MTVEPEKEKKNEIPRHPRFNPTPNLRPRSNFRQKIPTEQPEEHHSFFGKIFHSISSALGLSDDETTNTTAPSPLNPRPYNLVPTPPVSSTFIRRIPNTPASPLGQIGRQQLDQANRQREIMQQLQRTSQEQMRQQLLNQQREQSMREQQERARQEQMEREQWLRQQGQNQQRMLTQQQQERARQEQMARDRQMQEQRQREEQMRQERARMEEQQRIQREQQQMVIRARPVFQKPVPLPTAGPLARSGNGIFGGFWKPTPVPTSLPPQGHWAGISQWAGHNVSGPKAWDGGSRD